eukprot:5256986-Lingulodinium_polyedra.AAC.1
MATPRLLLPAAGHRRRRRVGRAGHQPPPGAVVPRANRAALPRGPVHPSRRIHQCPRPGSRSCRRCNARWVLL